MGEHTCSMVAKNAKFECFLGYAWIRRMRCWNGAMLPRVQPREGGCAVDSSRKLAGLLHYQNCFWCAEYCHVLDLTGHGTKYRPPKQFLPLFLSCLSVDRPQRTCSFRKWTMVCISGATLTWHCKYVCQNTRHTGTNCRVREASIGRSPQRMKRVAAQKMS